MQDLMEDVYSRYIENHLESLREIHSHLPALWGMIKQKTAQVIDEEREFLREIKGDGESLTDSFSYVVERLGHGWRPLILMITANEYGVSVNDALPYAVAAEIAHKSTAVLDDLPCMDDSDERWGRESCHSKFGDAMANLAVFDMVGNSVYSLVLRGALDTETNKKVALTFADTSRKMAYGQTMDLFERGEADLGKLLKINSLKTGSLYGAVAKVGGILGKAGDDQIDDLLRFGTFVGEAYQLKDDLYDSGSGDNEGKPRAKDAHRRTIVGVEGTDMALKIVERRKSSALNLLQNVRKKSGKKFESLEGLIELMLKL